MFPQFLLSPVPAVLSVEPGWARLSAELSPVARLAGARAVGLVALAMHALAVALAVLSPQPLPALAPACELLARTAIARTLGVAAAPVPARLADAAARGLVAHRVDGAVAAVGTLWPPEARMARTLARLLVALALLASTGLLAVGPPAVGVARAFARHIVALPVRVTRALPFAVWTPKLGGALWQNQNQQMFLSQLSLLAFPQRQAVGAFCHTSDGTHFISLVL